MTTLAGIPTFVVVGQPNEGKTTVLATLAENDRAEISPRPGTTLTAKRYSLTIDQQEVLILWDTPGFENSRDVLLWFREHQGDLPRLFVREFAHTGRFQQECEILRPIADGAAILYVVDDSRPPRQVDRREIEILRLCGTPILALINSKEIDTQFSEDWRQLLQSGSAASPTQPSLNQPTLNSQLSTLNSSNLPHIPICEFNAHRATFGDRLALLEAARSAVPQWETPLASTIQALRLDWDGRLLRVADLLIDSLSRLFQVSASAVIDRPEERAKAEFNAKHSLEERIRAIEQEFRREVRQIFRHSDEHWQLHDMPVLAGDLFSREVWQLLGLSKWQLVLTAAGIGAAGGVAVDVLTVGHSLGLGATIGAATAAAVAWAVADKAVKVKIPGLRFGPLRTGERKLGGETAVARVDPKSNIVWILIDRFLLYTNLATHWSHGRRLGSPMRVGEEHGKQGTTAAWREARTHVIAYINQLRQKKTDSEKLQHAERALRHLLIDELRAMTLTSAPQ